MLATQSVSPVGGTFVDRFWAGLTKTARVAACPRCGMVQETRKAIPYRGRVWFYVKCCGSCQPLYPDAARPAPKMAAPERNSYRKNIPVLSQPTQSFKETLTMQTPQDFDYDVVDPSTVETTAPVYPAAQWHNGMEALEPLGGVAYTGGIVIPTRNLSDGTSIPNFDPATITFRKGKKEPALVASGAALAVIRTRFCWKREQNGQTVYFPRSGYVAGVGLKGRLQVLVMVAGHNAPFTITFTGKASQHFENLLKDFDRQVVGAANKTAPQGKRLPRFAFWLNVTAGKHQKASADYDSVITPPTLALPAEVTRDNLKALYVGKENLVRFTALYHEAGEWAWAWDKPGAEPTRLDEPPVEETEDF